MWSLAWALSASLAVLVTSGEARQAPRPHPAVVQALAPKGLRVSLPDEPGMDLVIIHASISVPVTPPNPGQVSATVVKSDGGFWTLHAPDQQLKRNDVVFYWAYVSVNGQSHNVSGHHIVGGLVEPSCAPSVTTVNGQPACGGTLVFEDNFDTLNKSTWRHYVQFSAAEDLEFCTYTADAENSFVKDGKLHLKATILDDADKLLEHTKLEGCTNQKGGDFCERKPFSWDILPPARSAWLSTDKTFSFLYGRLEVRAKAAAGDWLLSYLYMEPRERVYGRGFAQSGRVDTVRVRGNGVYNEPGHDDWGARLAVLRTVISTCNRVYFNHGHYILPSGLYSDDFHVFRVTWTPHELLFSVDGVQAKVVRPPAGGRLDFGYFKDCEGSPWEKGTAAAPFDKEFFFYIMLKVAGFYDFADGSKSGDHVKPWKNYTPRGPLNFWKARADVLPTWKSDFEIDYIKVWAL